MSDILRVGVISDTHGLVRPEAMEALQGVSHILHGGDIGKEAVIRQLETLAPVTAVRGNIDKAPWADAFPEVEAIELGGVWIYLLHNIDELDLGAASNVSLVLTEADIKALSENSDTLTIHSGSTPGDDSVTVTGATLEGTRNVDGENYNVYTVGTDGATLVIDQDVTVII